MNNEIRYKMIPCSNCIFLGQYKKYDLFYCSQSGMPTLIIGFKENKIESYFSLPVFLLERKMMKNEILNNKYQIYTNICYVRAKEKGLIK